MLNKLDEETSFLSFYFSIGIVVAATYCGATSYGAITMMQVYY